MKNPASVLISPFDKIWRDLAAQTNAWTIIHKLLTHTIRLPPRLVEICKTSNESYIEPSLIAETQLLAKEALGLLASQQQAIFYPGLVGAWAIVEAAFDDLILTILVNDPNVTTKLAAAGIKSSMSQTVDPEARANELYQRIENKAKGRAKGFVVEIHRACFSALGIKLEYPLDRARVIEELNQVRNCILHHRGTVDNKAATISPRLAQHLGLPIPPTDPLFAVALTMLRDYTTAWVAALVHSPYLSDGLRAEVKNPFSS